MSMPRPERREAGFALILAILALMLLTFLGLTLATTTSTELQIATNHRWALQAQYNAEAGIEAAKRLLQNLNWALVLPAARPAWDPTNSGTYPAVAPPPGGAAATRNFEMGDCDNRGARMGFGAVLQDQVQAFENVAALPGLAGVELSGRVTIWVRRPIEGVDGTTQYRDSTANDLLIITAEGIAPATGDPNARNLARRTIEVTARRQGANPPCEMNAGQAGGGPEGNNYYGACGGLASNAMQDIVAGAGAAGSGSGMMQGQAPPTP